MADAPRIELDGQSYPLVQTGDMTMGEQRDFEKIADAGVDKLEQMFENDEWRAGLVVAWMAVSIHRERPTTRIADIVERLDQLKPDDLREAWANVAGQSPPEETGQPPSAPETGESATPSAPVSESLSEQAPESETRNGSGSPLSEVAAVSVLPTSGT